MIPKHKWIRNKKHLSKIRQLKCLFCPQIPGGIAHHIRIGTDGCGSEKPSDNYTIPVCLECHNKIHSKGEKTFYNKYGFEVEDMINKALFLWGKNGI